MKTIKIITIGTFFFFASNSANAQVSININLGHPAVYAPVVHAPVVHAPVVVQQQVTYTPQVEYYYIPDMQCYYDVRATQYIYLTAGTWVRSYNLPSHYGYYDINRGHKVVINDYHGTRPYDNYNHHKVKYHNGYHAAPQKTVVYKQPKKQHNRNYVAYSDQCNSNQRSYRHADRYDNQRSNGPRR